MWFRTHSSPTWHAANYADPATLTYSPLCCCRGPAKAAFVEETPPRDSSCSVCASILARTRRAQIHAVAGESRERSDEASAEREPVLGSERMQASPVLRPWPLLLDAELAAACCSVSVREWRRMNSRGIGPAPVRLGERMPRWRFKDLERWSDAGAPSREEFEGG